MRVLGATGVGDMGRWGTGELRGSGGAVYKVVYGDWEAAEAGGYREVGTEEWSA